MQSWNVKAVMRRPTSLVSETDLGGLPVYLEEEQLESHASLKDKQVRMEQQVHRIWT